MPWLSRSPCVPLPTVSEGEAIFTKILRENNISTAQTVHSPLSATPLVCENCLLFYCFPRLLRACLETNFLQSKLKSRIYLMQKNVWPCANSSLTSFVSMNKCPKHGATEAVGDGNSRLYLSYLLPSKTAGGAVCFAQHWISGEMPDCSDILNTVSYQLCVSLFPCSYKSGD